MKNQKKKNVKSCLEQLVCIVIYDFQAEFSQWYYERKNSTVNFNKVES